MFKNIFHIVFVLVLIFTTTLYAKEIKESNSKTTNKKSEIKEYILHHLKDSHDFNLLSYTNELGKKTYVGFPLPVILWDNGLKIFSSSRFAHGKNIAIIGNHHYRLYHDKIYKTDSKGTIEYDENNHPTNVSPLDLSLTKGVTSIIFTSLLMFFLFKSLADSYKRNNLIAKGAGRFFEPIVLYVRDEIAIPNIGEKDYKKYMSYLLTLFFFIWFLNMLSCIHLIN